MRTTFDSSQRERRFVPLAALKVLKVCLLKLM